MRRTLWICVAMSVVTHVVTYLLNTLLPLHVVRLGGTPTQVGALFTAMTLTSMVLRPLVGGWADRWGARSVMLPGAVVLAASVAALNLTSAPAGFIAAMVGIGLASGLISTPASILVAAGSPPERRAEALSLYYVASSLGVAAGPPAGLALAAAAGVPATFAAVTILAATGIALMAGLPPSPRSSAPRAAGPPWSRHALWASATLMLVVVGHGPVYAFLPLHAMAHGLGTIAWFFPLMSGWTIACRFALRRTADRVGYARVVAPAIASMALGLGALALPPSVPGLAASALLMGTATSVLYPTLVALVFDRTPPPERGRAVGTLSASWDLGVAAGSAAISALVQATSYGTGYLAAALGASLGLAVFAWSERPRRRA